MTDRRRSTTSQPETEIGVTASPMVTPRLIGSGKLHRPCLPAANGSTQLPILVVPEKKLFSGKPR